MAQHSGKQDQEGQQTAAQRDGDQERADPCEIEPQARHGEQFDVTAAQFTRCEHQRSSEQS
ncbi:MAG: hypothetical protein ABI412_02975 [Sphingomicrobium sp.]